MTTTNHVLVCLSALYVSICVSLNAADWLTFAHDPQRSGWAFEESTLTVENVPRLELKWRVQLKNEPRALTALTAPVAASDVTTTEGVKTVVYVAGSNSHFFALDLETGKVVWNRDFETWVTPKNADDWLCPQGINATPVIDKERGVIFVIALDGKVFGLDLGTGKTKYGPIQFLPPFSKDWSLNLVDGIIYTTTSQGCGGAQSGIYALDTRDPRRPIVRGLFLTGSVWGRGGTAIGKNGRIYAATGDGDFNPAIGNYGSSVVAASLRTLEVLDYFTPANFDFINKYDLDMASGGPVWFTYRNHNLVAEGGKEGVIYLMDADALGSRDHQTPLFISPRLVNDENTFDSTGIWGTPSVWKDEEGETWIYIPIWGAVSKHSPAFPKTNGRNPNGSVMAFKIKQSGPDLKPFMDPAWISGDLSLPEPVVISNGVVYALSTGENAHQTHEGGVIPPHLTLLTTPEREHNTTHAVLHALDAKTGKVLYDSGDSMASWVHFSGLAVVNGRILAVDRDSQLYCFGLKENYTQRTK